MAIAHERAEMLYAWSSSSLLVVAPDGRLGPAQPLSGYYYREARFLRTLSITLNGNPLWLCEAAQVGPTCVTFSYAYPELTTFGGGGTGQSGDEESTDEHGVPHRSIAVWLQFDVARRGLSAKLTITNHARGHTRVYAAIAVAADFVDIQDTFPPMACRGIEAEASDDDSARERYVERWRSQFTVNEIRASGGRAIHVVADVSDPAQVEAIAETAVTEFGRIDTWVNNAAVSMYGRVMELPLDDLRRQFDINYWGTVYGSRVAVPYLAEQGGALINVASVLADRAIPLQANYCAAKHAMKAFTDALRMELEAAGVPISVSLVKPGSTDTPFFDKARNYTSREPQPVPPVNTPEVPARVILECATRAVRDVLVGGAGKATTMLGALAPRLVDRYMERNLFQNQQAPEPASGRDDNLWSPVDHDGGERGRYRGRTMRSSMYTSAALHPVRAAIVLGAFGAAVYGLAHVAGLKPRAT